MIERGFGRRDEGNIDGGLFRGVHTYGGNISEGIMRENTSHVILVTSHLQSAGCIRFDQHSLVKLSGRRRRVTSRQYGDGTRCM